MRSIPTLIAAIATTWMVGTATAADDAAPHGESPPGVAVETTPPATRPAADEALEAALARALEDDGRVNAMQIKVAVREGLVTLTGTAKDIKEKDAAEATVRGVHGVRDVQNRLVVAEPGAPEPGTSMIPEVPAGPAR